jgi:hypothetical protein
MESVKIVLVHCKGTLPLKNISEIINNLELWTHLDKNGHLISFIENVNGS